MPKLLETDDQAKVTTKKGKKVQSQLQDLWWKACLAAWDDNLQTASEFVLAAEVSGKSSDDHATFIYFAWLNSLNRPVSPVNKPSPRVSTDSAVSSLPEKSPVQPSPVIKADSPVAVNAVVEEAEDWQQVGARKVKKAPAPPKTPVVAPVKAPPSPLVRDETAVTAWLAEKIKSVGFTADSPSESSDVEKTRTELLPPALTQFCLPVSLVFVHFQAMDGCPQSSAFAALAPLGEEPERQIEQVLGAAAACGAKLERAFVAPAQDETGKSRVRWFVELANAAEVIMVEKVLGWPSSRGALVTCPSS